MNQEYINKPGDELFILLAPLDWGLGHATRCIPLIHSLQKYHATVILAMEGPGAVLLQNEFPGLRILPLKGYRMHYSAGKKTFLLKIMSQLPKIQSAINQENKWLKSLLQQKLIHGIISDNRLGLHSKKIPCVYMTHQLYIETGVKWLNKIAQAIHYNYINRFGECWVPDWQDSRGLSGKLSHPRKMPAVPVRYLGPLSRFSKEKQKEKDVLLILLSGPEPQRTILEKILLDQVSAVPQHIIFIRGLPGRKQLPPPLPNVTFYNHLPSGELNALVQESAMVLARSGYSTIMDLAALQKKAILIPTPGQGEQEYLAQYLHKQKFFYSCVQENFELKKALKEVASFEFATPFSGKQDYDEIISTWLQSIKGLRAGR